MVTIGKTVTKAQKKRKPLKNKDFRCFFDRERAGIRTPDNLIKSQGAFSVIPRVCWAQLVINW